MQNSVDAATRATNKLSDAQSRAGRSQGNFSNRMNLMNKKVTDLTVGHLSLGAAVVGVGAGMAHALDSAITFEAAMSKVKAVAEATPDEFKALEKQAIDLGKNTSLTSKQVAEGMYFMAAAGLKSNEILDAMPGAINTAVAAGEDFGQVAEIMTTTMSGFNLKATDMSRIGDVLAKAANESQASIMDLGYTFKYVAPIASEASQSLETMAAASALLAKNGIKADTAGTSLRMGFERMAKLPKAARETLSVLGVKLTDTKGNFLPMADMLDKLHDKMKGLSNSARIGAISNIFGVEASPAWAKLIEGGGDKLRDMTDKMEKANGSAKQMADTMRDNVKGALDQFKGSIESLEISAIKPFLPMLKQMADKATGVSDSITVFFDQLQADEKFQSLGWDEKMTTVMDKATTAIETYLSGPGGEKFNKIIASLTKVGLEVGGALGKSILSALVAEIETSPWASIITGALAGGAVGSIVPGVGTIAGGLIGAAGGFGHYIGNKMDQHIMNNPSVNVDSLPGYATGLSYVPYDDMPVRVHRGERILTAEENNDYNSGRSGIVITGNTFNVRKESDIDSIARALAQHIATAGGAGA
jgi:TP901 family phage tail tape measure protein